jgi:hypothetical protein
VDDGYVLQVGEMRKDAGARITRGEELFSEPVAAGHGAPLGFEARWNATDLQFEWKGDSVPAGTFLIPRHVLGDARPSRFLLIVDRGIGRFERLVREES